MQLCSFFAREPTAPSIGPDKHFEPFGLIDSDYPIGFWISVHGLSMDYIQNRNTHCSGTNLACANQTWVAKKANAAAWMIGC